MPFNDISFDIVPELVDKAKAVVNVAAHSVRNFFSEPDKYTHNEQLLAGAISGWCTGFLTSKMSHILVPIGCSILILQVLQQGDYVIVQWDKVFEFTDDAQETAVCHCLRGFIDSAVTHIQTHSYFVGGFAGGFIIGLGH